VASCNDQFFIFRADQPSVSSTEVFFTDSAVLYISHYVLIAQLFLLAQHMYHCGHSTNGNHSNQGVTYVWYFIYGDNKKIFYDAGDKVNII
jgi:hypothetical protein